MTADLRYPIGVFEMTDSPTAPRRAQWIDEIAAAPAQLRDAVNGLDDAQLDTPYRPEGWTVRQVVHHLADSHINSYVRFKWALSEDAPTIKAYDEQRWAKLPDGQTAPLAMSLPLIDALHARWVHLLRSLSEADYERVFHHPDSGKISLAENLAAYAWHGRHHIAHITALRKRMNW